MSRRTGFSRRTYGKAFRRAQGNSLARIVVTGDFIVVHDFISNGKRPAEWSRLARLILARAEREQVHL